VSIQRGMVALNGLQVNETTDGQALLVVDRKSSAHGESDAIDPSRYVGADIGASEVARLERGALGFPAQNRR
jgi:hypothetical protein